VLPTSSEDSLITRTYAWKFDSRQWTWELSVLQSSYDYYKSLPRPPTQNYSVYVTHPSDDEYINGLAGKLSEAAKQKEYSSFQTVSLAAAFVQSLTYTSDSETKGFDEYPRYPVETLVDNGGDCEDTAILTAALINAMGYGVVLILFPETADSSGHMAVGVKGGDNVYGSYYEYQGERYYYLETTNTGWEIGKIPDAYTGRQAKILTMTPTPIFTHSWETEPDGRYLEFIANVENLGTAAAEDVYVSVGFDAGNNLIWNQEKSEEFTIGINGSAEVTLYLTPPLNKYTRLKVQIVYQGYAVDESYSEWFDTYTY